MRLSTYVRHTMQRNSLGPLVMSVRKKQYSYQSLARYNATIATASCKFSTFRILCVWQPRTQRPVSQPDHTPEQPVLSSYPRFLTTEN